MRRRRGGGRRAETKEKKKGDDDCSSPTKKKLHSVPEKCKSAAIGTSLSLTFNKGCSHPVER